jgi:hypothetical protein
MKKLIVSLWPSRRSLRRRRRNCWRPGRLLASTTWRALPSSQTGGSTYNFTMVSGAGWVSGGTPAGATFAGAGADAADAATAYADGQYLYFTWDTDYTLSLDSVSAFYTRAASGGQNAQWGTIIASSWSVYRFGHHRHHDRDPDHLDRPDHHDLLERGVGKRTAGRGVLRRHLQRQHLVGPFGQPSFRHAERGAVDRRHDGPGSGARDDEPAGPRRLGDGPPSQDEQVILFQG